ncbi:glycoside hydrolase family 57 protein [Sulfuriferula thiophila]|uniref:glycoside hydrolase family 57 protein n=1 Tax=Sulfuriferula thiophila TaxID=1781211 RepID=UPI000F60786D|nr:glycoside hydrolase family 57 protein [Sulfuriferula thiophila]
MIDSRLNVVLCWHMHQPYYRKGLTGEYQLPWVYLHGLKDYSDMAAHLERYPQMRAVVNFAPVLLEQLDDYAQQIGRFLEQGTPTQDRLLNLLAGIEPIPSDIEARWKIVRDCQRCHAPRMIHPYPAFSRLLQMIGATDDVGMGSHGMEHALSYLNDQYFLDLLTWYHLAWLGQSLRAQPMVQALFAQGTSFTEQRRRELLTVMFECLSGLIPRYRALSERGQVELSMTPYGHPIIPLLHSFDNMQCATPEAPRPLASHYPDGDARSRWHIEQGLAVFEHYFGHKPQGVWLAEGGISDDAVRLLDDYKIRWTASGEGVWRNSCHLAGSGEEDVDRKRGLFTPRQLPNSETRLFFRDDGLSDLIGFRYSDWHADDAVVDFVQHLNNIATFLGDKASQYVVTIILDGENAWEYYPENGHHFLDGLYDALSQAPRVNTTTFSSVAATLPSKPIPRICAGSWVYGSFSTWIGSTDKNRGWDYLVAAKLVFDKVMAEGKLDADRQKLAARQLGICEGSDWFWWFGDYNPAGSVSDFEQLFREQLRELYSLLGVAPPDHLGVTLSQGGGNAENAGTMRRNVE